jgi:hypothetical protein
MQKQKGITLIALIITVILLLILLGTSLGIVLRGDFFGKARKTAKMTDEKISSEGNTIEKGQNDWEQMEVDICSHIWGEERTILEPTCITPGKKVRECENCGKTMETEIPTTGHNYVDEKCIVCGVEMVIGANINYHEYVSESGGTVTSSYTSTKATRGSTDSSDADATYSVVNNSGIKWIVLGEENGQIKITTKNIVQPTSGGYIYDGFNYLRLQGQTGYDNFIDELNKISTVYGKGKYADTTKFNDSGGRSFKMEDLGYKINVENDTYGGSQTLPNSVSNADKNYWLASTYIYNAAGFVYYYVSNLGESSNEYLYDGSGGSSTLFSGVRPVVYLKSNIKLSYHATNGYTLSY